MIVFEGKVHISSWYDGSVLPNTWRIGVSDNNGWTADELYLRVASRGLRAINSRWERMRRTKASISAGVRQTPCSRPSSKRVQKGELEPARGMMSRLF
ncbi:hypothetical protein B0T25DRAFT_208169 [Lasiosphaeria hispida]|uniref:Uncharacterized protein n=1 Tax=Lasiosphaeria hispida TaxID=260671 RepID=A0AAJ0HJ48_9PEZI|nr:hypothetical protein B0T25DRAFT_208169 [Lasiosphaeria hispida]